MNVSIMTLKHLVIWVESAEIHGAVITAMNVTSLSAVMRGKGGEVGMTDNEKAVMTDCYKFLNEFNQPPPGDAEEWWAKAAEALSELGWKNGNHPLALTVGPAVYDYLEQKWKAINRKMGIR